MIKYRDAILENYSIDPVTAIITNSKGEIQETKIRDGRPYFKSMAIHKIQAHTNYGYKKGFDIHHLDENKLNNSLSNLVYLTHSEHNIIHKKGKTLSKETKQKIGKGNKGKTLSKETKQKLSVALKGKHHSEEKKRKIRETSKGKNKDTIWVNNGVISKRAKCYGEIPEGFVRGRLKNK